LVIEQVISMATNVKNCHKMSATVSSRKGGIMSIVDGTSNIPDKKFTAKLHISLSAFNAFTSA
jgi:hypothetical protein